MAGKAAKSDKDKAQIRRFKEAAKNLESDPSPEAFERAFERIVRPAKRPKTGRIEKERT
jgi:hypothetical protein